MKTHPKYCQIEKGNLLLSKFNKRIVKREAIIFKTKIKIEIL